LINPNHALSLVKGRVDEIKEFISANEVQLVIFDDDLSPSQLRNLEKYLKCRIYDRSLLILEIFLNRAQTSQAKNTGRAGPISVFAAKAYKNVDTPRASARGHWNAWRRR
jgi:hypothetical protein